jgi:hypothetical protein
VVGTSFVVVSGVLATLRGSYLTTFAVAGFMGFPVLLFAALFLAAAGKTTTRTTSDATGFTVWPDKLCQVLIYMGLALVVPSSFVFAIFLPRGMIDLPMSRGMQIFSPGLFVAAGFIAVGGLIAGWRRGGAGYLKFTPAMIEIADALKTKTLEWDDVVDVTDHSESKKGRGSGRSAVLSLRDGGEEVIGALNLYVPTGVPLYWMVRHYWRHPEDRMELVDQRAIERFREGRFDLT